MERKTESVKIGERAANPDNVTLRKAIADVWSSTLDIERVFSKVHSAGLSSSDLLVSRVTEVNKSLELELSSASFASLQSAIRRRRLEVRLSLPTKKNHRCIIFTAPHTLRLKRDSNMDHLPELETRLIASNFINYVFFYSATAFKWPLSTTVSTQLGAAPTLPINTNCTIHTITSPHRGTI